MHLPGRGSSNNPSWSDDAPIPNFNDNFANPFTSGQCGGDDALMNSNILLHMPMHSPSHSPFYPRLLPEPVSCKRSCDSSETVINTVVEHASGAYLCESEAGN